MSHVDDGTLHVHLDGELSVVERARVEAHIAECAPCRDRLAEARSLIECADRLLSLAAPPANLSFPSRPGTVSPPPRPRRRWFIPGAWAASIAVGFVAGWLLRPASILPGPRAAALPAVDTGGRDTRDVPAQLAAVEAGRSGHTDARPVSRVTQDPAPPVRITPGMTPVATPPALRGAAVAPQPAAKVAIAPAPAPAPAPGPTLDRRALAFGANEETGTSWPVITAAPARRLLGTDVVKIPGLPVRDIRRNPEMEGQVMVEQDVADGVVIQLLQGRFEGTTFGDDSNLKRTVGPLWVRISGPLSNDSLLKLLQLAR